ncbi:MAG: OprD family outer membrane porin [Campylobacterota bacterium]|nr:OprD family outer membrane porin [Campylobacterota bacterium]
MKSFSFVVASLLLSSSLSATETISTVADAFSNGKVKGLLRYGAQHRDTNYHILQDAPSDVSKNKIQSYSALGGYLGYETAALLNISLGATWYTSNPVGNNADDRKGLGGLDESNGGQDAYSVLGEAFLKYETKEHFIKVGRQEISDYRFVSLSNVRMTPFTHEGAIYKNSSIDGLKLNFGYLTGQKDRSGEAFRDMVRSARVSMGSKANSNIRGNYNSKDYDSSGNYVGQDKDMSIASLAYSYGAGTVEVWNYSVNDFVNTLYLYGDYSLDMEDFKVTFAGQYAKQQSIGKSVAGDVDTWFYGLKTEANIDDKMLFFLAYNEINYDENSYDGGTIFVRWGSPQMFNSFQIQDSNLAGTSSIGGGVQFDLGALGVADSTVVRFRHAYYDMPDELWMRDAAQDRSESTFDLRYSFTKESGFGIFTQMEGLSIQLRVAYNDFKTDYNIEEYIKTHGYNAYSVTDDFVDARLYIDYIF